MKKFKKWAVTLLSCLAMCCCALGVIVSNNAVTADAATHKHVYDTENLIEIRRDATCTMKGYGYAECTVDGCEKTKFVWIAATGHCGWENGVDVKVYREATCNTAGYVRYTCTNDGCDRIVFEKPAKLGHEADEWTVTKEVTCTTSGKQTGECVRCGKKITETIAKLGHNLIEEERLDPTCEEPGHYAYKWCDRCDYTTYKAIKATGHDWEEFGDPECEEGWKEHTWCFECGKVIDPEGNMHEDDSEFWRGPDEVVPHSYDKNGKCIYGCGTYLETYAVLGNVAYATIAEAIEAAESEEITINLVKGQEYVLPSNVSDKTVKFVGAGVTTVVDSTTAQAFHGANLTFENLKIQGTTSSYKGFQHTESVVYKNCTIDGIITLYGESVTFENCKFTGTGYLWTYGAKNVTFDSCTFNKDDSRAVLIYNEGADVDSVTFNNCKFTAKAKGSTSSGDWTAAVEIDSSLMKDVVSVVINKCTADSNYSAIVRVKSGLNAEVNVNGVVSNYPICTAAQLTKFASNVNSGTSYKGKTVALVNDIDLKNAEWTPIGTSESKFQGTFDGNGRTISNLKITSGNSYVGLFGYAANPAVITNFTVKNATVKGYLGVGVVAGSPWTATYSDINVTGNVKVDGMAYVGGVLGRNFYGTASDITVNVSSSSYVNAYSIEGDVAYRSYVGGIVGFMGEGNTTLTNVKSNIDVKGSTCDVGGITGIAHYGNSLVNCSSSGDVTITHSTGDASDNLEIGGIAGVWHNQTGYKVSLDNCSYTGKLSVKGYKVAFENGGLVGKAYSATGKGQLWIDGELAGGANYVVDDVAYATLAEAREAANGAMIYTYIFNANDLVSFAAAVNAGERYKGVTVVLTKDIDLAGIEWTPIGNLASYPGITFAGTFDGNGKTISNLNVESYEEKYAVAGFFGSISGATIQDVTFENATVKSSHYAGVIVAYEGAESIQSTIKNCVIDGATVVSTPELLGDEYDNGDKVGGIAGYIVTVDIVDCVVKNSTIQGYRDIGGIAGYAQSSCSISGNTVNNVTLVLDAEHNYKNYTSVEEHDVRAIVGEGVADETNTVKAVSYAIEGYVVIEDKADLVAFAKAVNDGDTYAGKVVVLMNDINLGGTTWTPIGNADNAFVGTFDGNGKTISNFKVNQNEYAGLFGALYIDNSVKAVGTVKNLTVTKATITSKHYAGVIAAWAYGKIVNCTVTDSKITCVDKVVDEDMDGDKAGAIVGYLQTEGVASCVKDCTAKNVTITANRDAGQLAGYAGAGAVVEGNVENVTITWSEYGTGANMEGGLIGRQG